MRLGGVSFRWGLVLFSLRVLSGMLPRIGLSGNGGLLRTGGDMMFSLDDHVLLF